jgi:hypothetical protein
MATERAAAIRRPGDSEGESAAATDLKAAAEERLPRWPLGTDSDAAGRPQLRLLETASSENAQPSGRRRH